MNRRIVDMAQHMSKHASIDRLAHKVSAETISLAHRVAEALPDDACAGLGSENDVCFEWTDGDVWHCVEVYAVDEGEEA